MKSDQLREAIKASGRSIASIARDAGIARTTLYSFVSGESQELRSDAHNAVVAAIEAATNGEVTAAELLGLNADTPTARAVRETGAPFEAAPVRVSVPADLADMARKYGLDVEGLIAEGGVPRLREAFKAAYIVRHKEAIDEINACVREHGTLSQRYGTI